MSFGKNLQILRKMRNRMTQEDLADQMGVSRQTISKWELDMAYPEMEKVLDLCRLFSCSMDQLIREDMSACDEAYSNIRIEQVPAIDSIQHTIISTEPEDDAKQHMQTLAARLGINRPNIIGWDFPFISPEQANIYNMHGYTAALVLEDGFKPADSSCVIVHQEAQKYIAITIEQPFTAPFRLIPNAYHTLNTYTKANGIRHKESPGFISCFEKEYSRDGVEYMDVYIAIEE